MWEASESVPYRRRGGRAETEHRKVLSSAKHELHAARQNRDRKISDAGKAVRREEKAHDNAINLAERQVTEAESPTGRALGQFGAIRLFERIIVTPQGTSFLQGARATVDTAGNLAVQSRSTFTRMAAGGLLLGPVGVVAGGVAKKNKVLDMRELYLLVDTPTLSSVIQCPPNAGLTARSFAAAINTAAANFQAIEARRPALIAAAQSALDRARADVGMLNAAKEALAQAEADAGMLAAIDRADQQVKMLLPAHVEAG